jgi:peroxiredoxin
MLPLLPILLTVLGLPPGNAPVLAPGPARRLPQTSPWQSTTGLRVGSLVPAFRLQDLTGQAVCLADFRGKVVYLDFWFSGCRPCVAEAPAAIQLQKRFRGQDVVFMAISTDVYLEGWQRTVQQHGLNQPGMVQLLDPEGRRAVRACGVDGFPTYWIIGRDGRIWLGDAPRPSAGRQTERLLRQALAAKPWHPLRLPAGRLLHRAGRAGAGVVVELGQGLLVASAQAFLLEPQVDELGFAGVDEEDGAFAQLKLLGFGP